MFFLQTDDRYTPIDRSIHAMRRRLYGIATVLAFAILIGGCNYSDTGNTSETLTTAAYID